MIGPVMCLQPGSPAFMWLPTVAHPSPVFSCSADPVFTASTCPWVSGHLRAPCGRAVFIFPCSFLYFIPKVSLIYRQDSNILLFSFVHFLTHVCCICAEETNTHTYVTCDTCILFHCCQGMQPVAHKICGPILGPGPACSWGGREQLPRLSACTRMGSRADSCPTPPAGVPSPHLL